MLIYYPPTLILITYLQIGHNLLDGGDSAVGRAGLGDEDLAGLVDDKNTARGTAAGRLAQANGVDEGLGRVAQQGVGQPLVGLEGGVGLGGVVGEAVDGEAGGGEGRVLVAEEASLLGAWGVSIENE